MKVAIVAPSAVPHMLGGAERLWDGLRDTIRMDTPHDVELFKLPVRERDLSGLVAAYRAFSELDLSHFDLVISSKYPAWMARHPNHVVYMAHVLRGLYEWYPPHLPIEPAGDHPSIRRLQATMAGDPFGHRLSELFATIEQTVDELGVDHPALSFPGPLARSVVHHLDGIALSPRRIRRHMAISATVAARTAYFPTGAAVEVLRPPSNLKGMRPGRFEYLFTASRLDAPKRIDLLVEAIRLLPDDTRLLIAGTGPAEAELRALIRNDPRVELLGHVTESELVELYADALAVLFVPLDEDYGLVTLEAFQAAKPVVTAVDSGGATELVQNGVNGYVADATPEALAGAIRPLLEDPELARRLGAAAAVTAGRITWLGTVNSLLDDGRTRATVPVRRPGRERLVVVSTFLVHPQLGGGQLRCFHLSRALTERYDVEIVSLAPMGDQQRTVQLGAGYSETCVPLSEEHVKAELAADDAVGMSLRDVLAPLLITRTPAFLDALARATAGASGCILAQPYLHPAVALVAPHLPFVYDAYNAEVELKRATLPTVPITDALLSAVRSVERDATQHAVLVTACSEQDRSLLASAYGLAESAIALVPNGTVTEDLGVDSGGARQARGQAWLEGFRRAGGAADATSLAVFMGSWHPPNVEAAMTAIRLAEARPDLVIVILGSVANSFGEWRLPPNVVMMGTVSQTMKLALLSTAAVALNPMLSGSGTNLKTLEYMATGAPVVSTPVGIRGLSVRDGDHAVVVPAQRLSEGVDRVLGDPAEAERMAIRARAVVQSDYNWLTLGRRFLALVGDALATPAARP